MTDRDTTIRVQIAERNMLELLERAVHEAQEMSPDPYVQREALRFAFVALGEATDRLAAYLVVAALELYGDER
jgi:hypothetical protein